MRGQWIGRYAGSNEGQLIVNLDDRGPFYQGVAYLVTDNNEMPSSAGFFRVKKDGNKIQTETDYILPINPATGTTGDWRQLKQAYPNIDLAESAEINGSFSGNKLKLKAITNLGSEITAELKREPKNAKSKLQAKELDWKGYKKLVEDYSASRLLYRGQEKLWKLRTAYHRRGRFDLQRFINEDIQTLHQHLSAKTNHVFNLEIAKENGAFYNLAQHHGYPTPLLDWTYSPYVAAFFAFRNISKENPPKGNVRIFLFDQQQWKNDWNQMGVLDIAGLHLSIMEFIAIENERIIPQQAVTTVTNVSDIESYIHFREGLSKNKYLKAIDIPATERNKAMNDLAFMGVTAGALLPGLDGACETLRERFFNA